MLPRIIDMIVKTPEGKMQDVQYNMDENLLIVDGFIEDKFVMVREEFQQIFNLLQKADSPLFIRSRFNMNAIVEDPIYTVTDNGENFPIGFIHETSTPSVDELILRSTWSRGTEEYVYGGIYIFGQIVSIDARHIN